MSSEQQVLDHKILRVIFLIIPIFFIFVLINVVGRHIYTEHKIKKELMQLHGEHWQEQYEARHGLLADSDEKTKVGIGAIILGTGIVVGIYLLVIRPRKGITTSKKRRRKSSRRM